ncbi:MAG: hypothetical protein ACI4PF_02945 [Christensenellales bacterium]
MANGFWNFLKKAHKVKNETNDVNSENYINNNPTEEQLKDNKNGNIAITLSIISCILLILFIALIVLIFSNNIGIGILSVALLFIPARLQMTAVKKAKKQLNINGKGKTKLLLVKYVLPTLASIISIIVLFCLIGISLK